MDSNGSHEDKDAVVLEDAPEAAGEDAEVAYEEEEGEPVDPRMAAVLAAAEEGDLETLCGLFSEVEVNARGEDGDSPLHIACLYGQEAVVKECVKRGADVNARDEDDSTPLHDACAGGFESIVALLLQQGASASAQDTEEETPLHHASRGGHAAVVAQLLQASGSERAALLQQRSSSGESALDMADSDAVRVLLSSE